MTECYAGACIKRAALFHRAIQVPKSKEALISSPSAFYDFSVQEKDNMGNRGGTFLCPTLEVAHFTSAYMYWLRTSHAATLKCNRAWKIGSNCVLTSPHPKRRKTEE